MLQTKFFGDFEKGLTIIRLIKDVEFFAGQSNTSNAIGTFYTPAALD